MGLCVFSILEHSTVRPIGFSFNQSPITDQDATGGGPIIGGIRNDITSEIGAITLYRLRTYLDFGKQ